MDLRALLAAPGPWLMDGAMGTLLYDRGIFVNVCYEDLSRTEPALVTEIHRAYVEAGARLLETNTFGANPVKLSPFGLEARTEEINEAGARCARAAAAAAADVSGEPALVLGAMGPLGLRLEPWGPTSREEARGFFSRQARGLLAGGVDGFLLETFQDPVEGAEAVRAVRGLSELPVVALVTLNEAGRTAYGADVATVVRVLEEAGVDALGFNCSVGPAGILEAVEEAASLTDLPLVAKPNAGLPRTVGDRTMYLASPEYMARYARRMVEAGARLVGGCCGTTPAHIARMRDALGPPARQAGPGEPGEPGRAPGPAPASGPRPTLGTGARHRPPGEASSLGQRSRLGAALAEGGFVTLVELVPPRGWDTGPLVEAARTLRDRGVTAVTFPDAPRGLARMGALPAAAIVAREAGIEVVAHYACRDRNMIGMLSDLLGAAASGTRNLLLVTGDRAPTGPYPDHTAVFDIDSIGLLNLVRRLNEGRDPGGHPVDPPTAFVAGVSLNPVAADPEREDRRWRWKVEAGAAFAVTQPIFDVAALRQFLARHPEHRIPVVASVWPLASLANAEFLANEVLGIRIPEEVVERMRRAEAGGPEAAREEGIRLAAETVEALRPFVAGVCLAAPRGHLAAPLAVLARTGIADPS